MKVHITKNGFQALDWDSEVQQYVEQPQLTFLAQLRDACYIDSDTTLGDIFNAVELDKPLAAFIAAYSWCDVKAFHAEAKRPCDKPSDLHYLQLAKYFEWGECNEGETVDVSGVGPDKDGSSFVTNWAIDFTPVNELAHLPVRLKPTIEIRKDMEKVGEDECTFTLLEVIGEIYWEISFAGSPEQRDEISLEIHDRIKAIENGTAELVPFDLVDAIETAP